MISKDLIPVPLFLVMMELIAAISSAQKGDYVIM